MFFNVIPRGTTRVFGAYRDSLIFRPFYDLEPPRVVPKDIYEDIIVCSLQARSLHRLRSELTMLRVAETEGTLGTMSNIDSVALARTTSLPHAT